MYVAHSAQFVCVCVPFPILPGLCGGNLNATTTAQTLTSPHHPNAYPDFTSCRWVLDAPPQESVKIVVQQLHLQPSQSCSTNYVELTDLPLVRVPREEDGCRNMGR